MSRLKELIENISTGGANIAGFRGSLFGGETLTRSLPDVNKITLSPYAPKKPKKKKKKVVIKESNDMDQVTTSTLKDMLRGKQREQELHTVAEVFALEDENGGIVKVYVQKDQAAAFKTAVERALEDNDEREIAEIVYELHNGFDIISVDWGNGTIPEDEEKPVENAEDADQRDYPDTEELGDVEADEQGSPDDAGELDVSGNLEELPSNTGAAEGDLDQQSLLVQIVQLLQAQADAQRAKADADKAKADVEAAEAAAKAAMQYASHQEEVMDMENYVKRQREDRRENQVQAKLLRYRHDLRKDKNQDLEDKLKDPDFLLNTLHKISIGESVTVNITPPTPEEEEILAMEDWEKSQKEEKKNMQLRDRLMRYRHANRGSTESTEVPEEKDSAEFDPKTGSLMDYLLRKRQAKEANVHNVSQQ